MSRAIRSKWLTSGIENVPPQRPPSDDQILPSRAQVSKEVVLADWSPTRKSAAREGQRVWREFGAVGLISACKIRDRNPLMMESPGQRNPAAENRLSASASSRTSISARAGLRIHRLDKRQESDPTRLDNRVLAQRHRKQSHDQLAIERGGGARRHDERKR